MPDNAVVDIKGPPFTEQIRASLELSGDCQDVIILEVAQEIERLDEILRDPNKQNYLRASQRAVVMRTRSEILLRLHTLIQERRDRQEANNSATLVAQMVIHLQDVMEELKLDKDIRATVVQNLLVKVTEEEKRRASRQ